MLQTILLKLLTVPLLLSSTMVTPHTSSSQVAFTQVLPEKNVVGYSVYTGKTLKMISTELYGTPDYWTTLWNSNQWIDNPNRLIAGSRLTIPVEKSALPDPLVTSLQEKQQRQRQGSMYVVNKPAIQPFSPSSKVLTEEQIGFLGNCEAGMDPAKNTGNGYYGAFQFSKNTWQRMNTGYERADQAPLEVQKQAVHVLLQRSNIYSQFPGCANQMHNKGLI